MLLNSMGTLGQVKLVAFSHSAETDICYSCLEACMYINKLKSPHSLCDLIHDLDCFWQSAPVQKYLIEELKFCLFVCKYFAL